MIRVCYVLSTSEKSGGANKSLIDLLKNLDREKIKPFVLLRRHGDIEKELRELDISYSIIPYINSVTTGNLIKDCTKKIIYYMSLPKIEKYYLQNKIDLVHNNSLPTLAGMEAANKLGIPYICHIREDVENGLGVGFLNKKKHLRIANKASRKLVISQFVKNAYLDEITEAEVIYDGMDTSAYLEEKEILKSNLIVASIYGNLDEQKGQLIAVKALEVLHERGNYSIHLNIVGNQHTEYAELVKKYVKTHAIKDVQLIDTISDSNELREHRKKDDINIICSRAEGLGRVTIESMLAGCLTIGANAGATPELISHDKTGLLFEEGDIDGLANILASVSTVKEPFRRLALQGQSYASRIFDIKKYVDEMEMEYRKALK